ncbi:hypothetical protein PHYPSEUDO_006613 [Phytophthora pseudosyringae]|uniref:Uncharacterized protein n=1 Tax=Phytophthora pseudosyringae TaxID=221518 RepID=A0A8T1VL57_9STRA|nr:hypothetical protein PHYPSEUDO_006613 [Phytophthora pseudosyringae]
MICIGVETHAATRETNSPNGQPHVRLRSRHELLETQVMFPDDFRHSMGNYGPNGPMHRGEKLKPIALVLRPNESCRKYEENFQCWLKSRGVSLSLFKDDPEEERRYRQTFAFLRADTAIHPHWDREAGGQSTPRRRSRGRSRSRRRAKKRNPSIGSARDNTDQKRARLDGHEEHRSVKEPRQHDSSPAGQLNQDQDRA